MNLSDIKFPAVAHRLDGTPKPFRVMLGSDAFAGFESEADALSAMGMWQNQPRPKNKYDFTLRRVPGAVERA